MTTLLNESIVEAAALTWFGELGYAIGHGPQLAPGEPSAERDSFGDVVLVGRLRDAIERLNGAIPEDARGWQHRGRPCAARRLWRCGREWVEEDQAAFSIPRVSITT